MHQNLLHGGHWFNLEPLRLGPPKIRHLRYAQLVGDAALVPTLRGALRVQVVAHLAAHGVDAFVTTRHGGVSSAPYDTLNLGDHVGDRDHHVQENRRRVADAVRVNAGELIFVRQVHGTEIVNGDDVTYPATGDIVTLATSARAAAVMVADCVPILMVDVTSHRLALVHAGWRGLALGVVSNALTTLPSAPSHLRVVVGPSISAASYQIGPEVAEHFVNLPAAVSPDLDDRSRLDLRAVVVAQLVAAGVDRAAIDVMAASTDGGVTYFSDRAQRPCGRVAFVAKWSS